MTALSLLGNMADNDRPITNLETCTFGLRNAAVGESPGKLNLSFFFLEKLWFVHTMSYIIIVFFTTPC